MTLPQRDRRLRVMLIICGVAVFIWSSAEDNRVLPVVLLSLVVSLTVIVWSVLGNFGGRRLSWRVVLALALLVGGLSGLSTSLITALLMLFKNVRHAHLFPDYPLALIAAMLERAPVWTGVGVLIGLGMFCGWIALGHRGAHRSA